MGGILRLHRKLWSGGRTHCGARAGGSRVSPASAGSRAAAPKAPADRRRAAEGVDDTVAAAQMCCRQRGRSRTGGARPSNPNNGVPTATTWSARTRTPAPARRADARSRPTSRRSSCNVGGLTFNGNDVLARRSPRRSSRQRLRLDAVRDDRRRQLSPRGAGRRCSRRLTPATRSSSRTRRCGRSSTRPGQQLPPHPAPARPAGGHDQRAAEPRHAAAERPRRRLRRCQHQLVGRADQEPGVER